MRQSNAIPESIDKNFLDVIIDVMSFAELCYDIKVNVADYGSIRFLQEYLPNKPILMELLGDDAQDFQRKIDNSISSKMEKVKSKRINDPNFLSQFIVTEIDKISEMGHVFDFSVDNLQKISNAFKDYKNDILSDQVEESVGKFKESMQLLSYVCDSKIAPQDTLKNFHQQKAMETQQFKEFLQKVLDKICQQINESSNSENIPSASPSPVEFPISKATSFHGGCRVS